MINVDEVLYVLGAILTVAAVISAVFVPLRRMIKKYDVALQETAMTLQAHADINAQYQALINESKADRAKLNCDVAAIKLATMTQIKLEINKIADKAIARGWIWSQECVSVEAMFEVYSPLGGNGVTANKVEKIRQLPIKYTGVREKEENGNDDSR